MHKYIIPIHPPPKCTCLSHKRLIVPPTVINSILSSIKFYSHFESPLHLCIIFCWMPFKPFRWELIEISFFYSPIISSTCDALLYIVVVTISSQLVLYLVSHSDAKRDLLVEFGLKHFFIFILYFVHIFLLTTKLNRPNHTKPT